MLLTVEKLIYGGDGLARLPEAAASTSPPKTQLSQTDRARRGSAAQDHSRGKAVFVPFVLAGEKVEATRTEEKAGFARAVPTAILEPSSRRVEPLCRYFTRCGGCHYQHADYEHQLEIKKEILRETLKRTAKVELSEGIAVHASPPWNYRNRSRLQVRTRPGFILGYFKSSSRDVLPVEECPISSPRINQGIAAVWKLGREGKAPDGLQEVEFFANAEDSKLLVELSCSAEARRAAVRAFGEALRAAVPECAGVVTVRQSADGKKPYLSRKEHASNEASGSFQNLVSIGDEYLIYQTRSGAYRVSAGSFFQTNRHMVDELVRIVTDGRSGELALDLYAGVGLFSTALCDIRHVVSVESSQTSSGDLFYNQRSNVEVVQATTEQYLARAETSGRFGKGAVLPHNSYRPDLAVVDPPRSGLGERVARLLVELSAPVLTYVSCDPATLARDLVILLAGGYRVEQVHLVDLFPQTYHIESVIQLRRTI